MEPVHFLAFLVMANSSFSKNMTVEKVRNVSIESVLLYKSGIYSTDINKVSALCNQTIINKSDYNWYSTFMLSWIVLDYFKCINSSLFRFCIALQNFISKNCSKGFIRGAKFNIEIQITKTERIFCIFI